MINSQSDQSSILILGASGFVGKAVSKHLENLGLELLTPSSKDCNLYDAKQVKEYLSRLNKSCHIVLCAGIVAQREPSDLILSQNMQIVQNFCENVDQRKIESIIYFSSTNIYGFPEGTITERTLPLPQDYYGIGKLAGEYILDAKIEESVPVTILRLPGIFGIGDDHKNTIAVLLNQLMHNAEVNIPGDGSTLRDYVDIDDVCCLVEHFLHHPFHGRLNVATGQSTSIKEIVTILGNALNISPKTNYIDRQSISDKSLVFDTSLLKRTVPNFIFTELKQSIEKYVNSLQHI